MLRLSSLTIHKFRNVAPNTILRFAGGMNLILGQNGTGKTTLLDLIVCAVNLNFDRYEKEELDIGFEFENATIQASATFRFSHAHATPPYAELAPGRESLARTIESSWSLQGAVITLEHRNNKLTVTGQDLKPMPDTLDLLSTFDSGLLYLATALRHRSENVYNFVAMFALRKALQIRRVKLDESLNYIANLISTESLVLTRDPERNDDQIILNTSVLQHALRKSFTGEQRALSTSSDVPFLVDATRLFRATDITAELSFNQSQPSAHNGTTYSYKGLNFILSRGRSTIIFENFSYGQKRLLGALHYFSENKDIIVADELTNGLHHEWIDFLIKELGERQSFLTSQNPVLLDFLTFDSAADVSRRLIRCTMTDDGELHWCNIPTAEAEDFFITYSANTQQVGEIMRIQGLW